MVSNGISDVVTASVHSEKTRLKKLMMMKMIIIVIIGERAKRARHIHLRMAIYILYVRRFCPLNLSDSYNL